MTTTTTEAVKDEGKAALAELPEDFTVTLDTTRPYAEVHGDHESKLPLGFIQDGIPFDKGKRLLKDALKLPDFKGAREALNRKLSRLSKEHATASAAIAKGEAEADAAFPIAAQVDDDPDAHIDLVAWATGKVKLMPHVVDRVARRRLGKPFRSTAEVKAELIERKMVDPAQVV